MSQFYQDNKAENITELVKRGRNQGVCIWGWQSIAGHIQQCLCRITQHYITLWLPWVLAVCVDISLVGLCLTSCSWNLAMVQVKCLPSVPRPLLPTNFCSLFRCPCPSPLLGTSEIHCLKELFCYFKHTLEYPFYISIEKCLKSGKISG